MRLKTAEETCWGAAEGSHRAVTWRKLHFTKIPLAEAWGKEMWGWEYSQSRLDKLAAHTKLWLWTERKNVLYSHLEDKIFQISPPSFQIQCGLMLLFFSLYLELYFHDSERKTFCQIEIWHWFNCYEVSDLNQNVWNAAAAYFKSKWTSWVAGSWG